MPCRVEPIYKDADHDTFMMLLRECNRRRVKSFDEKLREEVLSDSVDDAYKALLQHRQAQAQRAAGHIRSFEIVGTTIRARITEAKIALFTATGGTSPKHASNRFLDVSRLRHQQLLSKPQFLEISVEFLLHGGEWG
ncbi:MAG: hypothetical protein ACLFVW_05490 [Phycisphaerae bacterium]